MTSLARVTLAAVLLAWRLAAAAEPSRIEVFTREGCPRCADARAFLAELELERPDLEISWRDVDRDPEALRRLEQLSLDAGATAPGVPSFRIGGTLVVGFAAGATGDRIRSLLAGKSAAPTASGELCSAEPSAACSPAEPAGAVTTRLFGTLRESDLGLPLFTLALGLLDGVNPCAMWVLLFLLSMLVRLRDRRRMALVAGTFVVASGLVYFAFMAAWLNVFLLLGMSHALRVALGLAALAIGALNVKDFFALGRGPSLAIPASARPGIYARARAILHADSVVASLAAVAALALLVNSVELFCTAGLPAIYTATLARQPLSAAQHYAYLALYNLAYVADDSVMVTIAVVTLAKTRVAERAGRWLKLVSGAAMLALAAGLLFFPGLLV